MRIPGSGSRLVRITGASALTLGLMAGGYGVASAASGANTPAASGTSGAAAANGSPAWPGPGGAGGAGGPGGPHRGPGHGPGGVITAIGSNSFTLSHPDGSTQTVNTTASTTYTRDGASSTASALAVGERVDVRPTQPPSSSTSSSSPVTAASVNIEDPQIHGTVESVSNNVLTIVDEQGFWRTVDLSQSTTYTDSGNSSTQAALTQGKRVVATGTVDNDHTSLDATSVAVDPVPPAMPAH